MKPEKTVRLLSVVFFTFGITYLDFENLTNSDNLRPYIMFVLGILLLVYSFRLKKKNNTE